MKTVAQALIPFAALLLFATGAAAQGQIWRCGNTYTNDEAQARAMGCKLVEGGNVTVVQGTRVQAAAAGSSATNQAPATSTATPTPTRVSTAPASAPRVDANEQRARDSDARAILEAELKKAESRHAELLKEYIDGTPDKLGPETRNHQKYLDRVADLKASIERNERDIAGIKRELGRNGGGSAAR